jgi:hypothetical protein
MSIERIFYCDGPDCNRHARTIEQQPGGAFLIVQEDAAPTLHFCSWDCVEVISAAAE